MKKTSKIIIKIICVIVLIFAIDLIFIFTFKRPLLAIKIDNGDSANLIYRGLLYDTYNCIDYSTPRIKSKKTKFTCSLDRVDIGSVKQIIDKTKEIKDNSCKEEKELFYEDNNYKYYFNCIKSDNIIIKYNSGFEESINTALKYKTITIKDLDKFKIEYIKEEKRPIKKEDIISDKNLLFSITWRNTKCIPIQLNIYDNNKYILSNSYKDCKPNKTCTLALIYSNQVSGNYNYDVMNIINNSQESTIYEDINIYPYEIFTGNSQIFYTDNNNLFLKEFLNQINVNLKTCAKPDYN